ncbi:MAG: nitrogen regulation protein NR(I) [Hyphomicrobiales bacterium]|nr:MAG: nitrogen regulation protein NR(I) [Hyphomicrobiales bacterium]
MSIVEKPAEPRILIADDDTSIRTVLNQAFNRAGYDVRATGNAATLWRWVQEGDGDVVVTDVVMPDENIFNILPKIRKLRPELPVIVMSAKNTFMTAVTATEQGAYEYLPKPFDLNELTSLVSRALASRNMRKSPEPEQAEGESLPLIGRSAAMQEVYRAMARMMQTDLTVMILGESGTGKELVARALHDFGKRKNGPFVAVNMAAIPRELIEAELFGHEKGAFTGAASRNSGRFEQAQGGTLFLDEIGDMPMDAQTRLLRVLQEGEYTTVGGSTTIRTNVRIIAATNQNLQSQIRQGRFREDLFYRLNVVPIRIPPLRERIEDIPDLVTCFLRQAETEGLPAKQFNQDAIDRMRRHRWPGNVRELENMVRRLTALYAEETITPDIVNAELSGQEHEDAPAGAAMLQSQSLSELVEQYLSRDFGRLQGQMPPPGLHGRILSQVERPLIEAVLAMTGGNQIKASEILGLNRNTLRKKIRELDIRVLRGFKAGHN